MNKKMLLSILIIAFVGIAAAGTWANYVVSDDANGNTLTTGTMGLELGQAGGDSFDVKYIIPGDDSVDITYIRIFQEWVYSYFDFWTWSWVNVYEEVSEEGLYFVEPTNTGNIPGQVFISGTESSSSTTLPDHVHIYYSTDVDDTDPVELTEESMDTGIILNPEESAKIYFWYSYDNVADQNGEMGQTLTSNIKVELKNPVDLESEPIH